MFKTQTVLVGTRAEAAYLNAVSDAAGAVRKSLADVAGSVAQAQARLADGGRPSGMFTVLGHDPVKVEQASAALNTLLDLAHMVLPPDEYPAFPLLTTALAGRHYFAAREDRS